MNEIYVYVLGVLLHYIFFIHGEWHLYGAKIVSTHAIAFTVSICFQYLNSPNPIYQSLIRTICLAAAYACGLFSSIATYRIFFHPLRRFPGPRLGALTKLWHVWKCRDSQGHFVLHSWYQQYGSFVRTGTQQKLELPAHTRY